MPPSQATKAGENGLKLGEEITHDRPKRPLTNGSLSPDSINPTQVDMEEVVVHATDAGMIVQNTSNGAVESKEKVQPSSSKYNVESSELKNTMNTDMPSILEVADRSEVVTAVVHAATDNDKFVEKTPNGRVKSDVKSHPTNANNVQEIHELVESSNKDEQPQLEPTACNEDELIPPTGTKLADAQLETNQASKDN